MSDLSAKIATLKGRKKTSDIIANTNVSRGSFRRLETGGSVMLSTLREIATALNASESDWLELLVAWLKHEAGYDARKLWIETKEPADLKDAKEDQTSRAMMLFQQLNSADREQIMRVMSRPEVRACLPAINRVWEKLTAPKTVPPKSAQTVLDEVSSDRKVEIGSEGLDVVKGALKKTEGTSHLK